MMFKPKKYQSKYGKELADKIFDGVESSKKNTVGVFSGPTRCGKTIIVSDTIRDLTLRKDCLSFIWVSVGTFHKQSKIKIESQLRDTACKCSLPEDLKNNMIAESEILFLGWAGVNKKNNIFNRDNEDDYNLASVVANTKNSGREIVVFIDESHHTANTETSREIIDRIDPKVTVNISATPKTNTPVDFYVIIPYEAVIAEQMIKKAILVNQSFDQLSTDQDADFINIQQALIQRERLDDIYKQCGSKVKCLVLIQIADRTESESDKRKVDIVRMLNNLGITEKNGTLAIWLSDEKTPNLKDIVENESTVKVLIFKVAIALAWDCPRAQILVMIRDLKTQTISTQTVGRIMTTPEQKYYDNDILNYGYVYTNSSGNMELINEYGGNNYITPYRSTRNDKIYKKVKLGSIHRKRNRYKDRLSGVTKIFINVASEYELTGHIDLKPPFAQQTIISNGKIENIDTLGKIEHDGTVNFKTSDIQIDKSFLDFLTDEVYPFAKEDSIDGVDRALRSYLRSCGIETTTQEQQTLAHRIILDEKNKPHFIACIDKTIKIYKEQVGTLEYSDKYDKQEDWEVPEEIIYTSNVKIEDYKKCVMKPFYYKTLSGPETDFIKQLEKSKSVNAWYKNDAGEIKYLAIPYTNANGEEIAFYIDFVVWFKDGKIGLFDTKGGIFADYLTSKYKACGLYKYLQEYKHLRDDLWGGIVAQDGDLWRYYNGEDYIYDPPDFKNWKILKI